MTSPERDSYRRSKSALLRLGVVSGLIALVGLVFLAVDLTPDLSAMRVTPASGPHDSEAYALAARLTATARRHQGTLINITTAGAGANLAQLGDTDSASGWSTPRRWLHPTTFNWNQRRYCHLAPPERSASRKVVNEAGRQERGAWAASKPRANGVLGRRWMRADPVRERGPMGQCVHWLGSRHALGQTRLAARG
jgi:hypothetical protein